MADGAAVGEATVAVTAGVDGDMVGCTAGKVAVGESGVGDAVRVAETAKLAGLHALKPSRPAHRMPNNFSTLIIRNQSHLPQRHQDSIFYRIASV